MLLVQLKLHTDLYSRINNFTNRPNAGKNGEWLYNLFILTGQASKLTGKNQ